MQLALARFRKDKLSMGAFFIVAIYLLAAVSAPFLVKLGVLDPLSPAPGPARPQRRRHPAGRARAASAGSTRWA